MNWGSLLLSGWDDFKLGFSDLAYTISNLFFSLFYNIWRLLAWVADGIEGIFRNLAGIGSSGKDMASVIIRDDRVEAIFKNLVAFSTVMIIVFTIVKIVQEHYKEKDGGNPYKIVIRTFKGLLLFLFVTSAALLGLSAAGMIFRGLDAATGGGKTTVAGQVFEAMAADANRKRVVSGDELSGGLFGLAKQKYYRRAADPNPDEKDGKYVVVEMTGEDRVLSTATIRKAYYESHPEYKYGIVGPDGTVTPMVNWLKTQNVTDDYSSSDFSYVPSDYSKPWEDAIYSDPTKNDSDFSDGTVGYNNELLQGVSLAVQPTIDLAWSPVDIKNYNFRLYEILDQDQTVTVSILGNSVAIPIHLFWHGYLMDGAPVEKSMEESAKQFGFTLSAGVALQDGTISAKFDFDMFDTDKFEDLLSSVLVNAIYTFALRWVLEKMPALPAVLSIGPLRIEFLRMLSTPLLKMVQCVINDSMDSVLPRKRDEKGAVIYRDEEGNRVNDRGDGAVGEWGPELTVTPFAINSTMGSGVWVNVNQKSASMPISIESYEFDLNFTELWSQLTDTWEQMVEAMETAAEDTLETADEAISELEESGEKIQEQQPWLLYKQQVDEYNTNAKNYLSKLGNYLNLDEWCQRLNNDGDEEKYNNFLANAGFQGTYSDLETEIKSTFINMVQEYNERIGLNESKKPLPSADAIVTTSVYKPIIAFPFTAKAAQTLSVNQIRQLLTGGKSGTEWGNGVVELGGSFKCTVNMANGLASTNNIPDQLKNAYFRTIDWKAYNWGLSPVFKGTAELLYGSADAEDNPSILKNNVNQVAFMRKSQVPTCKQGGEADFNWDSTGVSYFLDVPGSPFNKEKELKLVSDSYWGARGISFKGTRYYQAYDGIYPVSSENNAGFGDVPGAVSSSITTRSVSKVRASSASNNAMLNTGKLNLQSEVLDNLNVRDEKSALANEFAKHIITFRPMSPDDNQEKDIKALDSWIRRTSDLNILGEHYGNAVHALDAKAIDTYMMKPSSRNYLVLTKPNTNTADIENYASFIGVMSYTDTATVNALYDYGAINYAVGFIAIISATGVYLNFAIGLIQRAVNLAVIYVLSPIAISFFPFDNGGKFKSQFVDPFYKEAISAFAVIVSLNIFIVMLEPVQTMVKEVTNLGLGWLGLIAFTSMLPAIRDTIAGVLGAGKMQSKGIGAALDGAMSSLGEGFSGLKSKSVANAGKGIAKGVGTLGKLADRMGVFGPEARAKRKAKYEELAKEGKLGWWGQHQLDKMNKKEAKENKMKKALETGNTSELTNREKKRFNKIQKKAEEEARKKLTKDPNESDQEYEARVAAKKAELAQDKKFQKSVNGIAKLGKDIKNSSLGLWAQKHFGEGSLIGESARMLFGHDGKFAKDSNSVLGAFIRLGDPLAREKSRDQIRAQARNRQEQLNKPKATMLQPLQTASGTINDGNNTANDQAREEYAEQQVAEKMKDLKKTNGIPAKSGAIALMAAKYRQENPNMTVSAAESKADYDIGEMIKKGQSYDQIFAELGGDKALALNIAKGMKAFEGLSFTKNIDMESDAARQSIRQIAAKNADESKNLENTNELLKAAQQTRDKDLTDIVNAASQGMGIGNDDAKKAAFRKILDNAGENDKFEDIVARVIDQTGADEALVRSSLSSQYGNFTNKVQFNSQIRRLEAQKYKHEAYAKAKTMVQGKVGDSIPEEQLMAMLDQFADVNDADITSLNVNSMGFKKREIMEKFESGDLTDENGIKVTTEAARDAMIERMRIKMTNDLSESFDVFAGKFTENVRKFEGEKRFKEEMMTTGTLPVMESFLERYKFHLTTNVDPSSFQLIANDTFLKELREKGDYATRGQILEMATNAAERMDLDALAKTGLNSETQQKLIEMVQSGKMKALKGIHDLGVMENSAMGSMFVNMGGSSLTEAQTSFARVLGLVEANQAIAKYDTQLGSLKSQEANARDQIRAVREEIPNLLSNPEFKNIMGDIVDAQGNHVKTMEEMANVIQANLDAANSGKSLSTSYIKATMDALNNLKNQYPNNIDLINAINRMTGGFTTTARANNYVMDIESVQGLKSTEQSYIQEATTKIGKGFSKVGS